MTHVSRAMITSLASTLSCLSSVGQGQSSQLTKDRAEIRLESSTAAQNYTRLISFSTSVLVSLESNSHE